MELAANTRNASATFLGLLLCVTALPANLAAQQRGPNDFPDRKLTPCDFLDPSISQFEHGKAWNTAETAYVPKLRKHLLAKSYAVQKECAYDFMRLRRKVVQAATGASTERFNLLADMKRRPRAYVGRPQILYGRVKALQRGADGASTMGQLLALDSDTLVGNIDVLSVRSAPRLDPVDGVPVRVVGYFVKNLTDGTPYFCAQRLEWLNVAADPMAFDAVRQKTRGIRPEEASAYYETLTRSKILPLDQQQQYASAWLKARIERRYEDAQKIHANERRKAESVGMTDQAKAAELVQIADAKLIGEQKRHDDYAAAPNKFPLFADVFVNPEMYMGKPVTMTGHVRKVMSYPADQDRYDGTTLHELWLFTDDSQQNPAVIVCSELPANFPSGDEVVKGVTVTGYFFKLYRYAADDANRAAPMLLAHAVQWQPATATYAGFGSMGTLATIISLLVGAALMMYLWSNHEGDRRAREALAMARAVDDKMERPVRFQSPDLLSSQTAEPRTPVEPRTPREVIRETSLPARTPVAPRDDSQVLPRERDIPPTPSSASSSLNAPVPRRSQLPEMPEAPEPRRSRRSLASDPLPRTPLDETVDPLTRPREAVERGGERMSDLVQDQTSRASDFVDRQKGRASDFVDRQTDRLARAADSVPFVPVPLPGTSRSQPGDDRTTESRQSGSGGREVQSSQIIGSQVLRVLQQDATHPGSRIELSNGSTLTLTNDVVGVSNRVERGARSDREFSQLEGLPVEHIAVDQWERVYLVLGRDVFVTEDFAENGQRCLIFGSLSSLFSEEPDLAFSDYWTKAPIR